ncbi:hypothetical protein LOD99_483 [Oopsacas minuta]|uniref:Uncharacterized protein n=1 Tax=Oopsacas minuta TaxID=111878 RepID=A0AAV7KCD4_9METZ|nr:hypothetical protein LOD99_483 [Oopsacas minuta]
MGLKSSKPPKFEEIQDNSLKPGSKGPWHKRSMESISKMSARTSSSFTMTNVKEVIDVNIFPMLAMITYIVVLIVLIISIGMETWTQRSLTRGQTKIEYSQGPIKRCIQEASILECAHINDINCSLELNPLIGSVRQLAFATDSSIICAEMKTKLNVSAAFIFLSLIFYLAALIFVIPLCKSKALYLASGISAIVSTICLVISLIVYGYIDHSFAGFFSVNGEAVSGCLTHGYGLVVAAGVLGLLGSIMSFLSLIKEWRRQSRMEYEGEVGGDDQDTM